MPSVVRERNYSGMYYAICNARLTPKALGLYASAPVLRQHAAPMALAMLCWLLFAPCLRPLLRYRGVADYHQLAASLFPKAYRKTLNRMGGKGGVHQ